MVWTPARLAALAVAALAALAPFSPAQAQTYPARQVTRHLRARRRHRRRHHGAASIPSGCRRRSASRSWSRTGRAARRCAAVDSREERGARRPHARRLHQRRDGDPADHDEEADLRSGEGLRAGRAVPEIGLRAGGQSGAADQVDRGPGQVRQGAARQGRATRSPRSAARRIWPASTCNPARASPLAPVPYKQSPQAFQDVAAGHIPLSFADAGTALPLITQRQAARAGGDLGVPAADAARRADARGGAQASRTSKLVSWHVLSAPAATPRPIVDRLHDEMKRHHGGPGGDQEGVEPRPASPRGRPDRRRRSATSSPKSTSGAALVRSSAWPARSRPDVGTAAPLPSCRVAGLQTPPNRPIAGAIDRHGVPSTTSRTEAPCPAPLSRDPAGRRPGAARGRARVGARRRRRGGRAAAARRRRTSVR